MAGLSPRHHKALDLIEENTLSIPEIARASKIEVSYLRRLMKGDERAGNMGQLFHQEVKKIYKRIDQRSRKYAKETKEVLFSKLSKWAKSLPPDKLKDAQVRRMLDALNTLAKSTPQVEINAYTQIYNQMNQEDILNEFKKLNTLSRLALDRGAVSGSGSGESGKVSRLIRSGGTLSENTEDSVLRASQ